MHALVSVKKVSPHGGAMFSDIMSTAAAWVKHVTVVAGSDRISTMLAFNATGFMSYASV